MPTHTDHPRSAVQETWPSISRFSEPNRSKNREIDGLILAIALALTSCVHAPAGKVALSLTEAGQTLQLVESGESLIGPTFRLGWEGDSWRGSAWGELAELEASGAGINGVAGSLPVHLVVESAEEKSIVRGMMLGQLGELRVSASEVEGTVGRCSYDLRGADGHHYDGYRKCDAEPNPEPISLDIGTLGEHPLGAGRIAPLVLFLAR